MLNIQEFLSSHSLDQLEPLLGIRHTVSPDGKLMVLNYDILSPKTNPMAMECRGLVLENRTWKLVARAFPRFFNLGECQDLQSAFDWQNFTATEKVDGSLILIYYYDGIWRINSRGSFGLSEVNNYQLTWQELVGKVLPPQALERLEKDVTYVFEICSLYNKIVRHYPTPQLFLLAAYNHETEIQGKYCDTVVQVLQHYGAVVDRPQSFSFKSDQEILDYLTNRAKTDPTFEGVVIRDKNGLRIKVKSAVYVALHQLRGNGVGFAIKSLIPIVLNGETDEILQYFPEIKTKLREVQETLNDELIRLKNVWQEAHNIVLQKDFALYIKERTRLVSILFRTRKTGKSVDEIFRESADLLYKVIFYSKDVLV